MKTNPQRFSGNLVSVMMYNKYIVLKKTGAALPRRDTMAERDTLKEERAEPEAALTPILGHFNFEAKKSEIHYLHLALRHYFLGFSFLLSPNNEAPRKNDLTAKYKPLQQ